jgi:endoglucanase
MDVADLAVDEGSRAPDLADPGRPLPALPLRAEGRWILDGKGQRIKLVAVNWYGAEERDYVVAGLDRAPLPELALRIRELGYNTVRLPWSNEMFERNPVIAEALVSKNPQLAGKRALEVLDAVIAALAHQGLLVVLDNHNSDADWCCSDTDDNGLWWNSRYSETAWISDWRGLVQRYRDQPAVVGVDLRNEPRSAGGKKPTWGGTDPALDWKRAAGACAAEILKINPNLLIVLEGLNYATDFSGSYTNPLSLPVAGHLVYSPHDYAWFHSGTKTYAELKTTLGNRWGSCWCRASRTRRRSGSASSAPATPAPTASTGPRARAARACGSPASAATSTRRTSTGRTGRPTARRRAAPAAPTVPKRRTESSTRAGSARPWPRCSPRWPRCSR